MVDCGLSCCLQSVTVTETQNKEEQGGRKRRIVLHCQAVQTHHVGMFTALCQCKRATACG